MQASWKLEPQAEADKVCIRTSSRKNWETGVFVYICALGREGQGIVAGYALRSLTAPSLFVPIVQSVGLINASPTGSQI